MERALQDRDQGQDVAWDEARAEVVWVAPLRPAPAAVVSARIVDTEGRTVQDSPATGPSVPSAAVQ